MRDPSKFVEVERALWSRYGIAPTERRVRLRAGNEVRVQEIGTAPPVVFVHGVSVAGTSWLALAAALKDDFRCLLIDRPGCGLSDPVPNGPLRTPSIEDKALTVGTAMPNTEVKIIDPETCATVPIGEIGELCVRGYHVMLGYHDMPDQTAEAIDADGWLHTGDLAAMNDRGYCTIEGHLKDMIIRGGENIYPKELEEMLLTHPAVAEVAVVGLPDDKYGEVVGAFVRPAPDASIDEAELFAFARERLAPHKTPKHWITVD